MTQEPSRVVRIERSFKARADAVFDAWTSPESGGSTTVKLVNSGISGDDRRDDQDEGWRGCLDELARVSAG